MKNTALTSLIIRLAGFALFIKIFDYFGNYFMAIYLSATMSIIDETSRMSNAFDKLYITGAILAFANLFLAIFLILKSDWIARKIIKKESELQIDITPSAILRIIIATIGILFCAKSVYHIPHLFDGIYSVYSYWESPEAFSYLANVFSYVIKAIVGVVFILNSDRISKFALGKKNSLGEK
ncbi:MAG: hypothetical protein ACJA1C_001180 [Crocinitomicaceae bacterium]|jgi:hypothetical protein